MTYLKKILGKIKKIYRIAYVLYLDIDRLRLNKEAAAMTYSTLLALVPSLLVIFYALSLMASYYEDLSDFNLIVKEYLLGFLTAGTGNEISGLLEKLTSNTSIDTLGLSGGIGFFITFFFLLETIEISFNKVWGVKKNRNFFMRIFSFFLFLLFASLLLTMVGRSLLQILKSFQGYYPSDILQKSTTGEISNFLIYLLVFFSGMRRIPNCYVRPKNAFIGSLVATSLFFLMIRIFSYYIYYAKNIKILYAGMATLPLFIFWIFLCWIVILLGVVVSWRCQYGIWTASIYDRDPFRKKENKRQRLKSLLPLIILIVLYHRKRKITGFELQRVLKVSISWIKDSVITLSKKGYLRNEIYDLDVSDKKFRQEPLLLSMEASEIKIFTLKQDFLEPAEAWLEQWKNNISKETLICFQDVLKSSNKQKESETLSDFMVLKTVKKKPLAKDS